MEGFALVHGLVSNSAVGYVKVRLQEYDDIVTDWLPIIKTRAMNDDENWPLETDELVVCLMLIQDGSICDIGYCLGAISNQEDNPESGAQVGKFRKYFSDGSSVEYDKSSHVYVYDLPATGAKWRVKVGNTIVEVGEKIKVINSAESQYEILTDLVNAIKALTVNTGTGPSSIPNNFGDFDNILTRISNLYN